MKKHIGATVTFIVIVVLVVAAVFGGRMADKSNEKSNKPDESLMNLISITVAPTRLSVVVNATSSNLTVSALFSQNGSSTGVVKAVANNLTFKSSNQQVATVSDGGQITGVSVGTTTVNVTYTLGNITKANGVAVTITAPPAPPGT